MGPRHHQPPHLTLIFFYDGVSEPCLVERADADNDCCCVGLGRERSMMIAAVQDDNSKCCHMGRLTVDEPMRAGVYGLTLPEKWVGGWGGRAALAVLLRSWMMPSSVWCRWWWLLPRWLLEWHHIGRGSGVDMHEVWGKSVDTCTLCRTSSHGNGHGM